MTDLEAVLPVLGAQLAGTLAVPPGPPAPAVLLIGGTFSDLRDGDADPRHRPDIPPHGMYRVLSDALVGAGFATLRFDRRGCGASSGDRPSRAEEVADALAAWGWLAARPEVDGAFAMVGESAGAYVLCRSIATGARPMAAVLQGALHRSIRDLIDFNGARARALYERDAATRDWLWAEARHEYLSALFHGPTIAALDAGTLPVLVVADERGSFERDLADLSYDVEFAPADQFAHVDVPTLVINGGDDLNVPTEDAFATAGALWDGGNRRVDVAVLAGCDHSMQVTPSDEELRIRERVTFASFHRPFHPRYGSTIATFLTAHRPG